MNQPVFCTAGNTAALHHAQKALLQWGYAVSSTPHEQVTHLLLPVPSFEADGTVKGGGNLEAVMRHLPDRTVVLGGNLPLLPYRGVDFLQDEYYLGENAAITAQCTVKLLLQLAQIRHKEILIIGRGRIGTRLAQLLMEMGGKVTIATRNKANQQADENPEYDFILTQKWEATKYDVIVNTAPAPMLSQQETRSDSILIDLASVRGISGDRVIWARGLPNKDAPDVSGILIAKTALRYALRKEQV